jgi:thiamine-monophosphate kinase
MTLALTLAAADESWLTEFSAGLFEAADRYRSALVGGDVTRGSQTVVSVQITGEVDPRSILERSGASPGEGIYVTGTTGDAAAGLALVRRTLDAAEEDRRFLVHRFARPEIAVEFAASIAPFAGGAIDLSDGLFADAGKLLAASGAGGRIEVTSLPRSAALERAVPENERLQLLLAGGDDYELCFTAAAANEERVLEAAERHAVRVTKIGEVTDGSRLFCTRAGIEIDFTDRGYRHF